MDATHLFVKVAVAVAWSTLGACLPSRSGYAGPVAFVALVIGCFGLIVL